MSALDRPTEGRYATSTTGSRHRYTKPSATQFFATFGYAWFTIGLFMGTLVLVVAVRGIMTMVARLGWEQAAQNRLLIGVIIVFVIASFLLARRVVRSLYRQPPMTRRIYLGLLAIPAVLSGFAWSNPTRFLAGIAGTKASTLALEGGPKFVFGPYPDDARLRQLQKEGVTAVISLQSPAVLVEISGINAERQSASRLGLNFIEAPMLPWVSDNTESLEKIKQIALRGEGTYYVHCGLGRDRVNIVKRVIEALPPQAQATVATAKDLRPAAGFEHRSEPFERGLPMKVRDGVWVVPYLNAVEFHGFIVQGRPGHVLLVLDTANATQRDWRADAEKKMKQYAVTYSFMPYPGPRGDTSTTSIVTAVKALQPPFTVMVPKTTFSSGDPKHPVARAIAKLYGASVVPLPKPTKLATGA